MQDAKFHATAVELRDVVKNFRKKLDSAPPQSSSEALMKILEDSLATYEPVPSANAVPMYDKVNIVY